MIWGYLLINVILHNFLKNTLYIKTLQSFGKSNDFYCTASIDSIHRQRNKLNKHSGLLACACLGCVTFNTVKKPVDWMER